MPVKQSIVRYTPPQFIHWGKWLSDSNYRRKSRHLARLKSVPRHQPTTTEILGTPLELVDSASFIWMYREIFEREIYRFRAKTDSPYVIDCGANIGLSVLYLKQLYPQSRIVAFEPDDAIFEVLQRNIEHFGYQDINLHCRAVWNCETTLNFTGDGADGGRLAKVGEIHNKKVKTIRLRDVIDRRVDFLKIDIEGAEKEVLQDCADRLGNVDNLFVEYHSFEQQPQALHILISILNDAGFRLHIHPPITSPQPFLKRDVHEGMDMQLNIFAFRP
jgi:FkbM family methyltransferase